MSDTDPAPHSHVGAPLHNTGLIVVLGTMPDADSSLDGLILAPIMCAAFDLGTVADAYAILNGLIGTIFRAASLDSGSVPNTNATLDGLVGTPIMCTTLHLGSVLNAYATGLGLVRATVDRAVGMTTFLSNGRFRFLHLGTVLLAHTSTDGLVGTSVYVAKLALFLGTVFAATAALLSEASATVDGAAVDILAGLLLRWRRSAWTETDFTTEEVCSRW